MSGVWLLSLEALDEKDVPVTLRFSTGQYHGDGQAWMPRIQQAGLYRAGLFAGDLLRVSRSGYGETTLINADGALNYLAGYALDGRAAVLRYAAGSGVVDVLVGTVADDTVSRQARPWCAWVLMAAFRNGKTTLQEPSNAHHHDIPHIWPCWQASNCFLRRRAPCFLPATKHFSRRLARNTSLGASLPVHFRWDTSWHLHFVRSSV